MGGVHRPNHLHPQPPLGAAIIKNYSTNSPGEDTPTRLGPGRPANSESVKQSKEGEAIQKTARALIQRKASNFSVEQRVRHRLQRWKLQGPPAHAARRVCTNFDLIREYCRPCVASACLRAVWIFCPRRLECEQCKAPLLLARVLLDAQTPCAQRSGCS